MIKMIDTPTKELLELLKFSQVEKAEVAFVTSERARKEINKFMAVLPEDLTVNLGITGEKVTQYSPQKLPDARPKDKDINYIS